MANRQMGRDPIDCDAPMITHIELVTVAAIVLAGLAYQRSLASGRASGVFWRHDVNCCIWVLFRNWLIIRMLRATALFLNFICDCVEFYGLFSERCHDFFVIHIPEILRRRKPPVNPICGKDVPSQSDVSRPANGWCLKTIWTPV
jgi:hypothetical protein